MKSHKQKKAVEGTKTTTVLDKFEPVVETVPLDDFHALYLAMLKEANEHNCEITIINIRPMNRHILRNVPESAYMTCLQSLSPQKDLDTVAVDILNRVHADRNNPSNHSICLADPSRNTAKIYSRVGEKVGWILHQKHDALKRLKDHSTDLILILLEHAVLKLQNASYIRNYKMKQAQGSVMRSDRFPCVCMTDEQEFVMIAFGEPQFHDELIVETIPFDDLFSPVEEDLKKYADLRNRIGERKVHIAERLKNLIIDERHLIEFLQKSRKVCLQTHAPQTFSANSLKILK